VMSHGSLQPHSHALSHTQAVQLDANNVSYPHQGSTAAGTGLQGDGSYPRPGTQSSDFWVPQVSADGRVSPLSLFQFRFPCLSSLRVFFLHLRHNFIPLRHILVMGAYHTVPRRHSSRSTT
jgi:hypothetical protein